MEWRRILKLIIRKYQRWQYRRTPRPAFIPTVTPIVRTWSATDERLERELYLANPHAVWLRPDRHEHKIPCWQIEGFWVAPAPVEFARQQNSLSSYQHAAMLQNAANQRAYSQMNLNSPFMQSPHQAFMNGLINGVVTK
jgi:hypothetical protein